MNHARMIKKNNTFTCIKKSTKFCSYGHEAVQDFLADKKTLGRWNNIGVKIKLWLNVSRI